MGIIKSLLNSLIGQVPYPQSTWPPQPPHLQHLKSGSGIAHTMSGNRNRLFYSDHITGVLKVFQLDNFVVSGSSRNLDFRTFGLGCRELFRISINPIIHTELPARLPCVALLPCVPTLPTLSEPRIWKVQHQKLKFTTTETLV